MQVALLSAWKTASQQDSPVRNAELRATARVLITVRSLHLLPLILIVQAVSGVRFLIMLAWHQLLVVFSVFAAGLGKIAAVQITAN